MLSNPLIQS